MEGCIQDSNLLVQGQFAKACRQRDANALLFHRCNDATDSLTAVEHQEKQRFDSELHFRSCSSLGQKYPKVQEKAKSLGKTTEKKNGIKLKLGQ